MLYRELSHGIIALYVKVFVRELGKLVIVSSNPRPGIVYLNSEIMG